jgi:hypothetical protein
VYFHQQYFKRLILQGQWDDAEKYLSGFTSVMENKSSMEIYFAMYKQKYLEALDK